MPPITHTLILLILYLSAVGWAAEAQDRPGTVSAQKTFAPVPVFNAAGIGDQLTLDYGWLFHPGDNPAWSSPGLDDRSWLPVDLHKPLTTYGFKGIEYGWLRLHVYLPKGANNLAFAADRTLGRYEVFADGELIGSLGDMSRHDLYNVAVVRIYPLPAEAYHTGHGGEVVLALRVSLQRTGYVSGGPEAPFLLGSAILGTPRSLADAGTAAVVLHNAPLAIDAVPAFLTAAVAFALFFSVRTHREYLLLAVYALLVSFLSVELLESWLQPYGLAFVAAEWLLESAVVLVFAEFIRETLRIRRSGSLIAVEVLPLATGWITLVWAEGLASYGWSNSIFGIATGMVFLVLFVMLTRFALAGNLDARLLLPGTLPYIIAEIADSIRSMYTAEQPAVHIGKFLLRFDTLADLFLELTLLLFIVTRSTRIARERNRVASEIEAAQTVQKLLLSRSEVETPGFKIDRVYRPAKEVGGDFFLLSPDARDGSLVALVGDVSGKGLTAAMHVSMILGALRRETERAPEQILRNLNEALVAQGATGFTTACCVRLQASGEFAVANAGHIAPYIGGEELPTGTALPMGVAPDQTYEPSSGRLQPDQTMVLLSDGVPEARTRSGELYGFERLAKLTLESAGTIADTAQQFGQEDDITVLSLSLRA